MGFWLTAANLFEKKPETDSCYYAHGCSYYDHAPSDRNVAIDMGEVGYSTEYGQETAKRKTDQ